MPDSLKEVVGRDWWLVSLKAREGAALVNEHANAHAKIEREIAKAETLAAIGSSSALSELAQWRAAEVRAAALLKGGVSGVADDEVRALLADSIASRYRRDPEDDEVVGLSPEDAMTIRALVVPSAAPPEPTLYDAKEFYLKERLKGGDQPEHREGAVRLERVYRRAVEALGDRAGLPLTKFTWADGRALRDHLLASPKNGGKGKTLTPATAKRELGLLRTVVGMALKEFRLEGRAINPFAGVAPSEARSGGPIEAEVEKRRPLPLDVIEKMRAHLTATSTNPDGALIWRILTGTGCRLGEVTGLHVGDVVTDGEFPHIRVQWNEDRRLKTQVSIRSVPLCGDALAAAKEALELPREEHAVFPRYAKHRGPDAASAILMKHLRKFTDDKRHTVHSLRHNMKDWLADAGVEEKTQNLLLGHTLGGIGDRVYGSDPQRLRQTTSGLRAALKKSMLFCYAGRADVALGM
ncbi:tyrosine-type recombinase/integrase [Falsirhodobacter xinxiangensis]|uniref:tyrosine-type recombinase/integrase n=1 Tax=Falsirhodobacter xinxiangensis TaxID=2530049 RepID=UPI00145B3CB6|nr:tyrosine-type recombinase/integrase [Rhodobacter xinxiangensis]